MQYYGFGSLYTFSNNDFIQQFVVMEKRGQNCRFMVVLKLTRATLWLFSHYKS